MKALILKKSHIMYLSLNLFIIKSISGNSVKFAFITGAWPSDNVSEYLLK